MNNNLKNLQHLKIFLSICPLQAYFLIALNGGSSIVAYKGSSTYHQKIVIICFKSFIPNS
jgi:hypothetical protein